VVVLVLHAVCLKLGSMYTPKCFRYIKMHDGVSINNWQNFTESCRNVMPVEAILFKLLYEFLLL